MFERLRRGAPDENAAVAAEGPVAADPSMGLDIETFEYVRVGRTALARVTGRWTGAQPGSPDFLLLIAADGESHEIRALAEGVPGDTVDQIDPAAWRAAFPMTLEVIEHPTASFSLQTSEGALALPKPVLRALYAQEPERAEASMDYPAEQVEELEAEVREAEAGVRWIQGQLSRERERRRALESDVESLRARNEELRGDPERIAALEVEMSELRLERDKRQHLEEAVASLTVERDRLTALEADANLVAKERARREAIEKEMAELAVDREHIRVLEERVAELTAQLNEAYRAVEVEKRTRDQVLEELVQVNAAAEATTKRLGAELEAARSVRGEARAEPAPRPFEEKLEAEAEPEPEPATGATPCPTCDASGYCKRCKGKGTRMGINCTKCGGTGLCSVCGGPGYVWDDDADEGEES